MGGHYPLGKGDVILSKPPSLLEASTLVSRAALTVYLLVTKMWVGKGDVILSSLPYASILYPEYRGVLCRYMSLF